MIVVFSLDLFVGPINPIVCALEKHLLAKTVLCGDILDAADLYASFTIIIM